MGELEVDKHVKYILAVEKVYSDFLILFCVLFLRVHLIEKLKLEK